MPVTVDPSTNANGATKPGSKAKSKNQFRRAKNKLKKEQNGGEEAPKVKVCRAIVPWARVDLRCILD